MDNEDALVNESVKLEWYAASAASQATLGLVCCRVPVSPQARAVWTLGGAWCCLCNRAIVTAAPGKRAPARPLVQEAWIVRAVLPRGATVRTFSREMRHTHQACLARLVSA